MEDGAHAHRSVAGAGGTLTMAITDTVGNAAPRARPSEMTAWLTLPLVLMPFARRRRAGERFREQLAALDLNAFDRAVGEHRCLVRVQEV